MNKKFTIIFDHGVLEIEYNREERRWIANSLGYTFKDILEMTAILGFIESKILLFNIKQEEKENGWLWKRFLFYSILFKE